eukprot:13656928-Alexandrium_andersonii.AAC.1
MTCAQSVSGRTEALVGCACSVATPSTSDAWRGTGQWDGTPRAAPAAEAALAALIGRGWISGRACRMPPRRPCW